ncbi:metallophosphoesterase family protein, partial [Staphylococcus aureus]
VALIGVNSAIPTAVGLAIGSVDSLQQGRLETLLAHTKAEGLIRLVMIHHPPLPGLAAPRRALVESEALAAVLARSGAELVIHG